MLPRLPVDLSTFSLLRKQGYLYIDKTRFAYDLITQGRRFFLSRPRRFGKSLFVSTLEEILRGNKSLFKGLFIAKRSYKWAPHGVITLDFSSLSIESLKDFKEELSESLEQAVLGLGIKLPPGSSSPSSTLKRVVRALHAKFGHVALLVDEYDYPILNSLQDGPFAEKIRKAIKHFFTSVKSLDKYVDFVFITGVTAFTKAGVFSGMNNLQPITLRSEFGSICGYTEQEVHHYFKPYFQQWSNRDKISQKELKAKIKAWYNGYRFGRDTPSVYNPFSLTHAFALKEFKNFWFDSGTPTFLIEELKKEGRRRECEIFDLEKLQGSHDFLESSDTTKISLPSILFQTGYLTLDTYDAESDSYRLKYPNFEVKSSLLKRILGEFAHLEVNEARNITAKLKSLFAKEAIDEVMSALTTIFSNIPAQLHMPREQFYHALLQVACSASDIETQGEYSMSQGRADLILNLPNVLYIIEVKLNKAASSALKQIERRKYYEPFLLGRKRVWLLGIAFQRRSKRERGKSLFTLSYASKLLPQ